VDVSEPKRFHELTREERIKNSDRVAVMELEKELRKKVKQEYGVVVKEDLFRAAIEKWLKNKIRR